LLCTRICVTFGRNCYGPTITQLVPEIFACIVCTCAHAHVCCDV